MDKSNESGNMNPSDTEEEADAVHRRFKPPVIPVVEAKHSPNEMQKNTFGVSASTSSSSNSNDKTDNEEEALVMPSDSTKGTKPKYGTSTTLNNDLKNGTKNLPTLNAPPYKEEKFGFDYRFFQRFKRLNGLLFLSCCSFSTALFLFLLCLVLLQEYVVYNVGLIASGFYKTLGDKDLHGFWFQTSKALGLIFAVSFIKSSTQYVQKVLTVTFRKLLCNAAHRAYFTDIRFYQLNVLDKAIDNPDQRMTQDIEKFCSTYCDVLPKIIVSPFTIGYYCYQGYMRSGWQGPVGCFGFFLVATFINRLLMSPIVSYVVKQEKCEGDFRFLHMLVRVHSESVAFQHGSLIEGGKVDDTLEKLIQTQHSLYLRQYFLTFSVNFIDYVGSIFSYLMLAIPIFSGRYEDLSPSDLGALISQNAFILIYLIYTFTSLVDMSGKFTDIAGVTHRIAQLLERLNALEDFWKDLYPDEQERSTSSLILYQHWINMRKKPNFDPVAKSKCNENLHVVADKSCKLPIWTIENLTFSPPMTIEPLIKKLNLQIVVGVSVIITGTSSAGKTSILRILRGLWPYTEGFLKRHYPPGPHGVYFCPQKPYLTYGTLRDQISFPLYPNNNQQDDQIIKYYLDKLRLTPILERVGGMDVHCSWSVFDSLSPGEMQRLCLLRIFYHRPVAAVLDEVTSALPLDMEEFVYSELRRLNITLISVGHRESIRKYHDMQLSIEADGSWKYEPIIQDL